MNFNRTQTVIVSDGTSFPTAGANANPTNITSGKIALVDMASNVLTPGKTISDTGFIRVVQGTSAGLKWSMEIPGKQISGVTARQYAPLQQRVYAIGYNRSITTGAITVNQDTDYEFSIINKGDKQTFSQRLGKSTVNFRSAATATQLTIAAQITNGINNSDYFKRFVTAQLVGDGTASSIVAASGSIPVIYGGTGASNYGVEITGKLLNQNNGTYLQEIVDFIVDTNQDSGFGLGFRPTSINAPTKGVGTYQQVYNEENFAFSVEGTINRTMFPITLPTAATSSTGVLSATVAGSGNVGVTQNSDVITFATTNASFGAGDVLDLSGTVAVIKYLISTTSGVLMAPWTPNTNANVTTKKRMFYDLITFEFGNSSIHTGSATLTNNQQSVLLAVPSIDAGNNYNTASSAGNDLMNVLNPYINSLGLASIAI